MGPDIEQPIVLLRDAETAFYRRGRPCMSPRLVTPRLILRVAAVAAGTFVLLVGNAGAALFWANYGSNAIGTADTSGQNVNQTFLAATVPVGVAADGQHLYWTNDTNGTV